MSEAPIERLRARHAGALFRGPARRPSRTRVHEMIMNAVEKPLLEVVMRQADGNQSKAADCSGINRNTLRRKLARTHKAS